MNHMFYFLLAFTAVLAATANAGPIVLDVKGAPVLNGNSNYYLRPLFPYGDLTLSPLGDNQCPLYIGLDRYALSRRIPVIISDLTTSSFIYETYDLTIKMDVEATTCGQPTYWSDPSPSTFIDGGFIVAGPIPSTGSFQIKKTEGGIGRYKIMFCPKGKVCTDDVSIFVDPADGVLRLTLSSIPLPYYKPFEFVFVKATEEEASSKTISII